MGSSTRAPTRSTRRTAGRPGADASLPARTAGRPTARWCATAYTLRADDDDFGQPGTLVREVLDDAARSAWSSNVAGHLLGGVTEPVLERAFEYWRNVDKSLGDRVEQAVRASRANPGQHRHRRQG